MRIFNGKNTQETNLVKLGDTCIERVWSKGNEKAFKLVGIMVDEKLKWDEHINYINRKVGYANFMLAKASKTVGVHNKKLLYRGLIHSHLVYGALYGAMHINAILTYYLSNRKRLSDIYTIFVIEIILMNTSSKATYLRSQS